MKLPPGYVPGLLQQHKATAKGGFGERLMKQFGWSEGKGLGVKEDGMAEAIKVKQKKDQTGVGANSSGQWRDKWWEAAYAQSISTINSDQVEITKLRSDSSSSDSDDSSDSEVAVDAARTGRQLHADGTVSSATAAEAKIAAQLAKDPWGRFGGRQGKMARIRAQEEAQLALLAAKAAPSAAAAGLKRKATVSATVDSKRRKGDGGSAGQPVAKPARLMVVVADSVADQLATERSAFSPTPATGWWGAKRFISSGAMGASGDGDKAAGSRERTEFTEDTQESLYMALHNAKTSGKTGLGKGKGSGIVGGAKWEGSKVSFDDGDDSSQQTAAKAATEQTAVGSNDGTPMVSPAVIAKRFPFNRVIRSALQEVDGHQLSVKALCKVVKQQWAAKHGSLPDAPTLKLQVVAKATKLQDVTISGKQVTRSG